MCWRTFPDPNLPRQTRGKGAEPGGRFYVPELDGLRFFAFFGVFIWHVPPGLAFFKHYGLVGSLGIAASYGVDLFFTLSAYLITKLLLRERAAIGRLDVTRFYLRRALRIWPLYFFCLGLWLCESRSLGVVGFRPSYLLAMAFFVGNFAFSLGGVFDANLRQYAPAYLWTISIEEQFYLLWPLFVRKASARGVARAGLALIIVASVARFALSTLGVSPTALWYNTFTRIDPMAAGILLATVAEEKLRSMGALSRSGLVLGAVASWLFAAYYCDLASPANSTLRIMMGYPAVALGSAAFLAAALGAGSGIAGRCLFNRWTIYLGKISYGLYVYHYLAILLTKTFMFKFVLAWLLRAGWPLWLGWPLYVALSLGSTVGLAACSYRCLEAPFLRLKQRFEYVLSRPV
jgi:peptidoglycan/LPS O-acetylase OafA/YrhL